MGRAVRAASILVGLGGLGVLIFAGTLAFGSFKYATYDCGSVISPKDPLDRVIARKAAVPPQLRGAHNRCNDRRSTRAARFVVTMGIGVGIILVSFATPTVVRLAGRRGPGRRRRASPR